MKIKMLGLLALISISGTPTYAQDKTQSQAVVYQAAFPIIGIATYYSVTFQVSADEVLVHREDLLGASDLKLPIMSRTTAQSLGVSDMCASDATIYAGTTVPYLGFDGKTHPAFQGVQIKPDPTGATVCLSFLDGRGLFKNTMVDAIHMSSNR